MALVAMQVIIARANDQNKHPSDLRCHQNDLQKQGGIGRRVRRNNFHASHATQMQTLLAQELRTVTIQQKWKIDQQRDCMESSQELDAS